MEWIASFRASVVAYPIWLVIRRSWRRSWIACGSYLNGFRATSSHLLFPAAGRSETEEQGLCLSPGTWSILKSCTYSRKMRLDETYTAVMGSGEQLWADFCYSFLCNFFLPRQLRLEPHAALLPNPPKEASWSLQQSPFEFLNLWAQPLQRQCCNAVLPRDRCSFVYSFEHCCSFFCCMLWNCYAYFLHQIQLSWFPSFQYLFSAFQQHVSSSGLGAPGSGLAECPALVGCRCQRGLPRDRGAPTAKKWRSSGNHG